MAPGPSAVAKCKDCKSTTRVLSYPGPRCATCWRGEIHRRKEAAHDARIEKVYKITGDDYRRMYEAQGGRCAICRRATGKARKLAVDHNHQTGEVRGLLCKPCNRYGLGVFARDNPEIFDRAADYLRNPPARRVLRADTCQVQQPETPSS